MAGIDRMLEADMFGISGTLVEAEVMVEVSKEGMVGVPELSDGRILGSGGTTLETETTDASPLVTGTTALVTAETTESESPAGLDDGDEALLGDDAEGPALVGSETTGFASELGGEDGALVGDDAGPVLVSAETRLAATGAALVTAETSEPESPSELDDGDEALLGDAENPVLVGSETTGFASELGDEDGALVGDDAGPVLVSAETRLPATGAALVTAETSGPKSPSELDDGDEALLGDAENPVLVGPETTGFASELGDEDGALVGDDAGPLLVSAETRLPATGAALVTAETSGPKSPSELDDGDEALLGDAENPVLVGPGFASELGDEDGSLVGDDAGPVLVSAETRLPATGAALVTAETSGSKSPSELDDGDEALLDDFLSLSFFASELGDEDGSLVGDDAGPVLVSTETTLPTAGAALVTAETSGSKSPSELDDGDEALLGDAEGPVLVGPGLELPASVLGDEGGALVGDDAGPVLVSAAATVPTAGAALVTAETTLPTTGALLVTTEASGSTTWPTGEVRSPTTPSLGDEGEALVGDDCCCDGVDGLSAVVGEADDGDESKQP